MDDDNNRRDSIRAATADPFLLGTAKPNKRLKAAAAPSNTVAILTAVNSVSLLLDQTDLWVRRILPFLGPGYYLFVAGVSRQFKEWYQEYFSSLQKIPQVINVLGGEDTHQAVVTNTFYSAAFCNLSCGKLWKETRKEEVEEEEKVSAVMAKSGNLDVMKWTRQNGCEWDERMCKSAAEAGHLEILKWARQHGCEWDEWTCSSAAYGGHLEVLKWARANGCYWDYTTCAAAAQGGRLQVLKWARENGCPWDQTEICDYAAGRGHLEVLKWA